MKPRNLAQQTMRRAAWVNLCDELQAQGFTPDDVRRRMLSKHAPIGDASNAKRKLMELLERQDRVNLDETE
jgi:hypothetical protein